jgi:hypothetical protein
MEVETEAEPDAGEEAAVEIPEVDEIVPAPFLWKRRRALRRLGLRGAVIHLAPQADSAFHRTDHALLR